MSCRLDGFDYTKPLFYMVTLKKRAGLSDFSSLAPPGPPPPRDAAGRECWLLPSRVTRAFSAVIRGFSEKWPGIAPIQFFAVMPDHLHLLLKIEDNPARRPLGTFVFNLARVLSRAYWEAQGGTETAPQNNDGAAIAGSPSGRAVSVPPVFEHAWHDWIVMKRGQLNAFARYILENPRRA